MKLDVDFSALHAAIAPLFEDNDRSDDAEDDSNLDTKHDSDSADE